MAVQINNGHIAAVRFNKVGKLYYFDVSRHPDLKPADHVIVDTTRGRQLGQIIAYVAPESINVPRIKSIRHPATARDLMLQKLWEAKEVEALIICREQGQDLAKRNGMKFIKARYNYDGSQLIFLFTSEEPDIDTTKLRKLLSTEFNTRVDVKRIGARDAARIVGEFGSCGAPRCCSTHLTEFSPVSIKMAKAQGISLNPTEITGMCGRLRCCLVYEYEQYVEANKTLPRRGKWIGTPHGEGKVVEVNALKQTVAVYVDNTRHEIHRDDLIPLEELRALKAKAAQGCSKEGEGGVCECGARVRSGKPSTSQPKPSQQGQGQAKPAQKQRPKNQQKRRGGQGNQKKKNQPQGQRPAQDGQERSSDKPKPKRRRRRRRRGGQGKPPSNQSDSN